MSPHSRHTLLIVDDEENIVQSLRDLLRNEYQVFAALNAEEALDILKSESIDIIMSDQRMPDMTGAEFFHVVRDTYPDAVRLLFTAYADLDAVAEAINQGHIFGYLTKPWKTQELRALLHQAANHCDLTAQRKQLLHELKQKNQELQAANDELSHANELKRNFMKVASHELRTPLTIIYGLSELSCRADDLGLPVANLHERIYQGCKRLTNRVDQMMKMLWAEQFDRPLCKQSVDVAQVLRESIQEITTFAARRGQSMECDIPDDLGTFHADPEKLRDAVQQLLVNAVKFTPNDGEIRLTARKSPNGIVEITVSDSGLGIAPAELDRIFEPFFTRLDVSRHASGEFEFDSRGLGLGLSLVKAFVEMHGGTVSAQSQLGAGTAITIGLPQDADA